MASNKDKQVVVCSAFNSIKKAQKTGILNLTDLHLYSTLVDQLDYTKNISKWENISNLLQDKIIETQYNGNNVTTNIKSVIPNTPFYTDNNGNLVTGSSSNAPSPIISAGNLTVTTIVQETLFGVGTEFDTYKFTIADFLGIYTDNNDDDFYALEIDRSDLDGMSLKFNSSPTTGNVFGENASVLTILRSDIPKWSLYTSSTAQYTHQISFRLLDLNGTTIIKSNTATLTVDRTALGNQPATIGDITIAVENRAVTTLTLAMFTSSLTPPYNDPEGDLIDAIRVDEISTANKGIFYLNGIAITEGQIISREDIASGLFTHESVNQDDIWSDAFEWSARDEGSKIWIN